MTNLEMWSTLCGVVLPILVAIVNQPKWPSWGRSMATVGLSVVTAAVTCYLQGDLSSTADLAHSVLIVLTAALGSYHLMWKPSKLAPKLEVLTSPKDSGLTASSA